MQFSLLGVEGCCWCGWLSHHPHHVPVARRKSYLATVIESIALAAFSAMLAEIGALPADS